MIKKVSSPFVLPGTPGFCLLVAAVTLSMNACGGNANGTVDNGSKTDVADDLGLATDAADAFDTAFETAFDNIEDTGIQADASKDLETVTDAADAVDAITEIPADAAADAFVPPPEWATPYGCVSDPACPRVMVAAHRGFHRQHPENSLAGIIGAAAVGVDFSEVDVRETLDGVLVLMHDSNVDRTSDGTGDVSSLTWEQILALTLDFDGAQDPDEVKIPLFSDALAAARSAGIALYVDQKTSNTDLVIQAVAEGNYWDVAMIRDDFPVIVGQVQKEPRLWVMPAIATAEEFQTVLENVPGLRIVELSLGSADPVLTGIVRDAGIKVQQDVLGTGDLFLAFGDYTGWKAFIDAGVSLPQTDYPDFLVPAVRQYNETGIFPETGPIPE